MKLIIGLGNIGEEYDKTRHNIGFEFIDYFSGKIGVKINKKSGHGLISSKTIAGEEVILLKPTTYMNESGKAANFFKNKYGIPQENILVIHDDVDLPPGKIKIKKGGGDAGHKGIASIIKALNSGDFIRLRIGIGKAQSKREMVDYVLGKFTPDETAEFEKKFPVVEKFILDFITMGYEKAAGRFKDE
jgi:PTH1 family peptidyl-tRNA hydrolase